MPTRASALPQESPTAPGLSSQPPSLHTEHNGWVSQSPASYYGTNSNHDSVSPGIRRSAFEKLAALAVKSPARDDGSELARLAQQSRPSRQADGALSGVLKDQAPTSRVPMVRRALLGIICG